jgi:hypothetical protein
VSEKFQRVENKFPFLIIDGNTSTQLESPAEVCRLATERAQPDGLWLAGYDGSIRFSSNAGFTWVKRGQLPKPNGLANDAAYRINDAAFASDPMHVILGTSGGAFVSSDGGVSWIRSQGLGTDTINVFSVAISPRDSSVVWAEAVEALSEPDVRFIAVSVDHGHTFSQVITPSKDITLTNGVLLTPHPQKSEVVYFVFGTSFQVVETKIYKFDLNTRKVTFTRNPYPDIHSLAFSPADPNIMYFGLGNN